MPPAALPAIAIGAGGLASGIGAGISGGAQARAAREAGEAPYKFRPGAQRWATGMAGQYPELAGLELPGIGQEAVDLISRLMSGQLPTGVSQALGGGAERAYGAALSGLSDIGAGPATLAGMRGDIMGRLGEQKALMGWQGMQTGLGRVGEISELMMQPQKWGAEAQRKRWTDIAQLFLQTPGAAQLRPGQQMTSPGGITGGTTGYRGLFGGF